MSKQVNKKVGKGLASAIETSEGATEKAKQRTTEASNAASHKTDQVYSMLFSSSILYLFVMVGCCRSERGEGGLQERSEEVILSTL